MLTERISQARVKLLIAAPFFGALAFRLNTIIDDTIPTACTDGKSIRYSPAYCAKLTDPELAGLIAEEIGHCAFQHLFRIGSRKMDKWNTACDQVLWRLIRDMRSPRVTISADCEINPEFDGLSAEEIYHLLPDETPPPPAGNFSQPADNNEEKASQSLSQEWESAVQEHATAERMKQGKLPAYLETLLGELRTPKVPWTQILKEFCTIAARDDYSMRRPNRRHLTCGIILPTLHSQKLGHIVCAIDTSGSMDYDILTTILSELQGILDTAKPEAITLIDCDAEINQVRDYHPGDTLTDFRVRGGGGTDFRPVFHHLSDSASAILPACLIYLTDMCGTFPLHAPHHPTLWINYGNPKRKAPFGTTIHVSAQ